MSASRQVRGSAAGLRIEVGREFQSSGAANVKVCLPVSSSTDGICSVTAEEQRVEQDDWSLVFESNGKDSCVGEQCMLEI